MAPTQVFKPMVMLINQPWIEERLIAARRAAGIDHHDEVWEGVYVVSPIANNDHVRCRSDSV